jgi:Phosphatidylserine/phosphatidylglycerophosphate/cardiolipin synthases and related enzymes
MGRTRRPKNWGRSCLLWGIITFLLFGFLINGARSAPSLAELLAPAHPSSTSQAPWASILEPDTVQATSGVSATAVGLSQVTPVENATTAATVVDTAPATLAPTASGGDNSWYQIYFVHPTNFSKTKEIRYAENGLPSELENGSMLAALLQHINSAQRSIHIASYETNLTVVADALIQAHKRGVDVRWITDDQDGLGVDHQAGRGQFTLMAKAGIPVITDKRPDSLMHDKFWIFDGQTVWTGSANITVNAMFEQDNNTIVIESPALAQIYESQFAEMWAGDFGPNSPSNVAAQQVTIDGTPIQVLFSPEDNAVHYLLPYIQSAQKSIRFLAFTYTDGDIEKAMASRAQAGVSVAGVFETENSYTTYSKLKTLYCLPQNLGITLRTDGNPSYMHHKVIIIDDRIVITGSFNFTDSANEDNNENVLVIQNPDIVAQYVREYNRVFALGNQPNANKISCGN